MKNECMYPAGLLGGVVGSGDGYYCDVGKMYVVGKGWRYRWLGERGGEAVEVEVVIRGSRIVWMLGSLYEVCITYLLLPRRYLSM